MRNGVAVETGAILAATEWNGSRWSGVADRRDSLDASPGRLEEDW